MEPNRHGGETGYRYGFNGKEHDPEVKGDNVQYDYGFRIYDARVGRFLSLDPLFKSFPWYTPYQFAGNKPVAFLDLDGLEDVYYRVISNDLDDGSVVIQLFQGEGEYNSNENGQLLIHNIETGTTYRAFPFGTTEGQEVGNTQFDDAFDSQSQPNSKTQPNTGEDLTQNPTAYYFGLDPNAAIFEGRKFSPEQLGRTKDEMKFKAGYFNVFGASPSSGAYGGLDPFQNDNQLTNRLTSIVNEQAGKIASGFNQTSEQITKISITLDNEVNNRIGARIQAILQEAYPNATVTVVGTTPQNQGEYSSGYSVDVMGSEVDINE